MKRPTDILAERVRTLRTLKKLSQAALASKVGMQRADLTRLEGGDANPSAERLAAIASALGVTVGDLFTEPKRRSRRAA